MEPGVDAIQLEKILVGLLSTMRPPSKTTMTSASLMVEMRCETSKVVRWLLHPRSSEQDPLLGLGVDAGKGVIQY